MTTEATTKLEGRICPGLVDKLKLTDKVRFLLEHSTLLKQEKKKHAYIVSLPSYCSKELKGIDQAKAVETVEQSLTEFLGKKAHVDFYLCV